MARKDILKMFMVSLLFAIVAIGLSACSKDDEENIEYWMVTLDNRGSLLFYGGVIGTLSSLFIAAPVAYLTLGRTIKEEGEIPTPAKK